jgi:hypothetical protein
LMARNTVVKSVIDFIVGPRRRDFGFSECSIHKSDD